MHKLFAVFFPLRLVKIDIDEEFELLCFRYQKFTYLRSKITDQMKTREISAQDSFIQSVIHNKEPKITLSLSNLEKLKCFSENISTMQKRQQTEKLKNYTESLLENCRLKKLRVDDLEKIEILLDEVDKEENHVSCKLLSRALWLLLESQNSLCVDYQLYLQLCVVSCTLSLWKGATNHERLNHWDINEKYKK